MFGRKVSIIDYLFNYSVNIFITEWTGMVENPLNMKLDILEYR